MGNMCGKEFVADTDGPQSHKFSSLPPNSNAKVAHVPKKFGGPPRILGSESSVTSGGDPEDARKKAGEAAEVSPKHLEN